MVSGILLSIINLAESIIFAHCYEKKDKDKEVGVEADGAISLAHCVVVVRIKHLYDNRLSVDQSATDAAHGDTRPFGLLHTKEMGSDRGYLSESDTGGSGGRG